jgi:hypothetical protein
MNELCGKCKNNGTRCCDYCIHIPQNECSQDYYQEREDQEEGEE